MARGKWTGKEPGSPNGAVGACHNGSPSASDRPVPACHFAIPSLNLGSPQWARETARQLSEPVKEPEFTIHTPGRARDRMLVYPTLT